MDQKDLFGNEVKRIPSYICDVWGLKITFDKDGTPLIILDDEKWPYSIPHWTDCLG